MSQTAASDNDRLDPGGLPEPDHPELTRDEIFEMLSNRRRRYAIHLLQQSETERTLSNVAEHVAAWENEESVDEVSAKERKRVYTSLQQFHLPKMDEKGVVDFDSHAGVVKLDDAFEDMDIYMEVTEEYDFPWSVYYLGLASVSTVFVALSWAGVPPFARIPNAGWVVFILTTLGLFTLAHTALTRRMRLGRKGTPPENR